MSTIFSRIISGELPGHFVWRDERTVAFLSIHPLTTGHTLVVPVAEIDHWLDLPAELAGHCMRVARAVGHAIRRVHSPVKVGLMIAGLEVPHCHLHVAPINGLQDLDFANAAEEVPPAEELATEARRLRRALSALEYHHGAD